MEFRSTVGSLVGRSRTFLGRHFDPVEDAGRVVVGFDIDWGTMNCKCKLIEEILWVVIEGMIEEVAVAESGAERRVEEAVGDVQIGKIRVPAGMGFTYHCLNFVADLLRGFGSRGGAEEA